MKLTIRSIRSARRSRRGVALVMMALLVLGLAGVSMALLAVTNAAQKESRASKEEIRAELVAEAALSASFLDLSRGGTGVIGSAANPIAYNGASYWVTAALDVPTNQITLTATGLCDNAGATVEYVVHRNQSPLFLWAAFGDEGLTTHNAGFTDSYNSTFGTYTAQATNGSGAMLHAFANGDVGSNGDISMVKNSIVFGDATPGPGGTVTILNNAQLSGSQTPATVPVSMPPLVLPNITASGPLTVPTNGTRTIGPGSYHFTNVLANNGGTLNVVGPTTMICDSLDLRDYSRLLVNSTGGTLELYVVNNFMINKNVEVRSLTNAPKDIHIQLASDNVLDPDIDVTFVPAVVTFKADSKLYGTIYAPYASIFFDSNFELFGSIVARIFAMYSTSRIHYDEDLALHGPMSPPHYKRISWRISG